MVNAGLVDCCRPMVTLKEIAAAVGVSTSTVSRVLNFDSTLSVTAPVRRAIIETAEALSYATPRARNRAAQHGLNRLALVHFLAPDQELVDPYYVGLRLGIERRCATLKIETVKLYHAETMPDQAVLQAADGVIAVGWHNPAEVDWLRHHSRAMVFADFSPAGDGFDTVESDLVLGTQKLLCGLRERGYRRIGFVGWIDRADRGPDAAAEKRCLAYVDWMQTTSAYDPSICLTGTNTEESGYDLTQRILAAANRPDALITANDNMAVGAYRAIADHHLRIPDDIAIASFNDISVAQFLSPPLSTVRLPAEEIGECAVDLLLERIAGREIDKRVTLGSTLIWRDSTAGLAGRDAVW